MKKNINILIVDDDVVRLRLNDSANKHFKKYLKEGDYPFTINVLDEKITNDVRLWKYLDNKDNISPDFILLDWLFENNDDLDKGRYTGKRLLKQLIEKKKKAFKGELDEQQLKLFKNLEIIALSSKIKTPDKNNLDDMFAGGCIAAVAKDTFNVANAEGDNKSFLLDYINTWLTCINVGQEAEPGFDTVRFGELEDNTIYKWIAKRKEIKGIIDNIPNFDKEDKTKPFEKRAYFEAYFKPITEGKPFSELSGDKGYQSTCKNRIYNVLKKKLKDDKLDAGELTRWLYYAMDMAAKEIEDYQYIREHLESKGYYYLGILPEDIKKNIELLMHKK